MVQVIALPGIGTCFAVPFSLDETLIPLRRRFDRTAVLMVLTTTVLAFYNYIRSVRIDQAHTRFPFHMV